MPNASEKLAKLVAMMPDPDERGMYCTNIDKDKIEKAVAQISLGGRKNIMGVIDMLVEPGKGDDVKARYALHCLGLHACNTKDKEALRRYGATLASQIGRERPAGVQEYLIQELQYFGGKEDAKALNGVMKHKKLAPAAAMALAAIKGVG
ncbi:MAG: hypothetical protein ACYS8Z_05695 [Planctomycetota bacterium]|jgi:hypothetical protein